MDVCAPCAYWCPQRPEEDVQSSATGVRGSCEPLDVGARNPAWVLCKSSNVLKSWAISPVPRFIFHSGISLFYCTYILYVVLFFFPQFSAKFSLG